MTTDLAAVSGRPRHPAPFPVAVGVAAPLVAGWAVAAWLDDPLPLLVLVSIAGAIAAVRRVELAAAGLAALIAGNLSGVASSTYGLPSPSIVLGGLLLIGILIRPDRRAFLPPMRLLLAFGAYGLVVLASTFWAGEAVRALGASDRLARDMLLAILVASVALHMRTWRLTLWAVVSAITLLGAVGLLQVVTGSYGSSFAGLGGATVANIVGGSDDWRITGPLGDPNYLAQTLVVGAGLALAMAVHERRVLLSVGAAACAAITLAAIVPTYSRGGVVAALVVIGAFAMLRRPSRAVLGLAAAVVMLGLLALPGDLRERLSVATSITESPAAVADPAVRGRLSEMYAAAAMFRDAPLAGVGAGNYPVRYLEYAQTYQLDDRRTERAAHSLYLEIVAETGVVGMLAFAALLAAMAGMLRVHWRDRRAPPGMRPGARGPAEALLLGSLGFLATSVLLHGAHTRTFWLLAALTLALPAQPSDATSEPRATRSQSVTSSPENSSATPASAAAFTRHR